MTLLKGSGSSASCPPFVPALTIIHAILQTFVCLFWTEEPLDFLHLGSTTDIESPKVCDRTTDLRTV